jgi:hypothetical protein
LFAAQVWFDSVYVRASAMQIAEQLSNALRDRYRVEREIAAAGWRRRPGGRERAGSQ